VWTHGGAWLGGSKDEIGGYLRMIAGAGFTVVGVRYSLAPEATYPTPIRQLMAALRYLSENADRLHVDKGRLILAGDSAGAQISAQLAAMVTSPTYAYQVGVEPTIEPEQLSGVALCCGIFDLSSLSDNPEFRSFQTTVGWSYSGTRDFRNNHYFVTTVSVASFVTEDFPRTFITVGNADPLAPQSTALASILESKGVNVETLFFPKDHQPPLSHEYQFDLSLDDGRAALQRLIDFFARCTADRNAVSKGDGSSKPPS
jgi:acetyl esterase/lipase